MIAEHDDISTGVADGDDSRVVLEVRGTNVLIRSMPSIDDVYTSSVTDVINAAARMHACIILDPDPIRCDEVFAASQRSGPDLSCPLHPYCDPVEAEVVTRGIVRIPAEGSVWLVDLSEGRYTQVEECVDARFLSAQSWKPLVAVSITPTRLTALGIDGGLTSARRAHMPTAA